MNSSINMMSIDFKLCRLSVVSLSLALNPSAGEPVGQVLNSHGSVRGSGVALDEPVPDSFSAGALRMTLRH